MEQPPNNGEMDMTKTELDLLKRIRADQIAEAEYRQLGHRIIFDPCTGVSKNIPGIKADPADIDPESGLRVR